jgi:hypothetical protein
MAHQTCEKPRKKTNPRSIGRLMDAGLPMSYCYWKHQQSGFRNTLYTSRMRSKLGRRLGSHNAITDQAIAAMLAQGESAAFSVLRYAVF